MALFHVDASVISKGKTHGGAQGFARYLTGDAERMQQYLVREQQGRDDLVAEGVGALPAWATSGAHFFAMADRFERQGGLVARHYQVTLPRELSPEGRLGLADDIRAVFFERYPHVWAVHCPPARDGSGEQPHLHVMFSTRREDVPSERTPKQWFARAANPDQDPLAGGVRKDRGWDRKQTLQGVRAEVATLTNAALEREGCPNAVSQVSLHAQGHDRAPSRYVQEHDREQVAAERLRLRHDYHPWENDMNLAAWHEQQQREGIRDLSRAAMIDHVRDRFWRHDHSPARAQEREASLLRTIDREYAYTGRERVPLHQHAPEWQREPERDLDKQWEKPLIGNRHSRIYHTPEQANYGDVIPQNQERFWTEHAAIDAGYRRAANDQYGPGSGIALEEQARHARRRAHALAQAHHGATNGRGVVDGQEDRMREGVHVEIDTHEREVSHA
jgi:hypothetical protein